MKDLLLQLCMSAHTLEMTFPPVSRLIPRLYCRLSIETEERRREEGKKTEDRSSPPSLSLLSVLLPSTLQFVLSGICLAWLNKANCRAFVEVTGECASACTCAIVRFYLCERHTSESSVCTSVCRWRHVYLMLILCSQELIRTWNATKMLHAS